MASPLSIVHDIYVETLHLSPDDSVIAEVILCAYMSNLIEFTKEPVWLQIVGSPASHKTESLRPYLDYGSTEAISSITSNSLISGYRDNDGNDPSMILRLDGRVLVVKDMTAIHSMDKVSRDKIFGDLRDAFDGVCAKASGTAGVTQYRATFGMIFAITEVIDDLAAKFQQLGERFLTFRTYRYQPSHRQCCEIIHGVLEAARDKDRWQAKFRTIVQDQLDAIRAIARTCGQPQIPDEIVKPLEAMSHILSYCRTSPIGTHPVSGEMGSRVAQQLMNIGSVRCIADLRSCWDQSDLTFIRRIVLDTLPIQRRRILQNLYGNFREPPLPITVKQLAQRSQCTVDEIKSILLQYLHTRLVVPDTTFRDREPRYVLHPDIRHLFDLTGLLEIGPHLPGKFIKNKQEHLLKGD